MKKWGIVCVLVIALIVIAVPMVPVTSQEPYTDTETYWEKEPYYRTETYTTTEPYTASEWVYPSSAPKKYYDDEGYPRSPSIWERLDEADERAPYIEYVTRYRVVEKTREVLDYRDVQKTRKVVKLRDVSERVTILEYFTR